MNQKDQKLLAELLTDIVDIQARLLAVETKLNRLELEKESNSLPYF